MLFVRYYRRSTKRDILLSHISLVPSIRSHAEKLLAIPSFNVCSAIGETHDRFTVYFFLFAITPFVPGLLLITSESPLFIRSYLSLLFV